MRPISSLLPKELVPLGATPALRFIVQEAWDAGIRELVIVHRAEKPLLESYLRTVAEEPGLEELELRFVVQEEPRGLADAIEKAMPLLEDEPFAMLLPDNFLPAPDYALADLVSLHRRTGADVVGVLELDHRHSGRFGNCGRLGYRAAETSEAGELAARALRVESWESKGDGVMEIAPGEIVRRNCGRYICLPHVHRYHTRARAEQDESRGELSEVDIYQRVLLDHPLWGLVLPDPVFDLGNPDGYLAACAWIHEHKARTRSETS